MKSDPTKEQREACYYILSYLSDNPEAGDTLEGIVQWWLLQQRIKFGTQTVAGALATLVAEGFIVEQTRFDSRTFYRVNRSPQELQAMLNNIGDLVG
jgi:DNA-binding PadR family transcriptional regulator